MLLVPTLLLVVLPLVIGLAARASGGSGAEVSGFLDRLPGGLAEPITSRPPGEQMLLLVNGYLLAPLFLIVPLMVSAVLAADAFAGEKERRTLESLLHLPMADQDLFVAKLLGAFVPALAVSWIGFILFAIVSNGVAWPVMHRIFVPTQLWMVMILWVAPAVAALGLGVMVRVSARAQTAQEANQLGGAVILPAHLPRHGPGDRPVAGGPVDGDRHRRRLLGDRALADRPGRPSVRPRQPRRHGLSGRDRSIAVSHPDEQPFPTVRLGRPRPRRPGWATSPC